MLSCKPKLYGSNASKKAWKRGSYLKSLSLGVVLCLATSSSATPQSATATSTDADRPKIGLVLGGGGAKGGAHVGVIEVLEELNIPIDYIAGTSIGAIVGGLYASGMSSAELRSTLTAVDWDEVLYDKPPRRNLTFRRKEEDARYLFDLEVGIGRNGLRWPGGLLGGQNLFFMLQALTLPVADVKEFDQLPIPFRAVATDVNNGEAVVLGSGQLASAIRASMALPAIFAAVEFDGRLLVDGGLVKNLPVDVVREMGADIVIAVDLGALTSTEEVDASMVQVFEQTMRVLTRPNVEPQLAAADIVISPPVATYGTMAFNQISELMTLGLEDARTHADDLRRFSVGPKIYAQHRAQQQREKPGALSVEWIEFEGNQRVDDRIVEHQVRLEPGTEMALSVFAKDIERLFRPGTRKELRRRRKGEEEIDLAALSDDMRRLYGLGDFEAVDFNFEERDGKDGVVIRMRESAGDRTSSTWVWKSPPMRTARPISSSCSISPRRASTLAAASGARICCSVPIDRSLPSSTNRSISAATSSSRRA